MRRAGQAPHHFHCRARENMLVFEHDVQVDACICWQFMMLFKVLHLKILWTLLSAISTSQPSLPALAFQHMTCSKIAQKIYYPEHMPCGQCSGQLDGTLCLQTRSIQSIRLLASAQGNGKKYPEHTPFGKCSGQSDGSLCLQARSILSIRFLARALGKNLDYAFVS